MAQNNPCRDRLLRWKIRHLESKINKLESENMKLKMMNRANVSRPVHFRQRCGKNLL